MKYILDIVLVLALCWLGWAWNGEKQNGLALSDEIDQLKATAARLEGVAQTELVGKTRQGRRILESRRPERQEEAVGDVLRPRYDQLTTVDARGRPAFGTSVGTAIEA